MPKKIFVFGCARSGTTLLLNLFCCFSDVCVIDREHRIEEFERYFDRKHHLALKRTPTCALDLQEQLSANPNIWVVDIVRDPRDVVTSIHPGIIGYYTDFGRWQRDIRAIEEAAQAHMQIVRVQYECLVTDPNALQTLIASKIDLVKVHAFSDISSVMQQSVEIAPLSIAALGGIRPLERSAIGRWRRSQKDIQRVLSQSAMYPQMLDYLIKYGYERDTSWYQELLFSEEAR